MAQSGVALDGADEALIRGHHDVVEIDGEREVETIDVGRAKIEAELEGCLLYTSRCV